MKLREVLKESDITVDEVFLTKLEDYTELLLEWNRVHNLTGAKSRESIYKNIVDSIYPIKFIDEPKSLIDIGSGAGFPGVPLGIVWSKTKTTLCEPLKKRASFLRLVSVELELEFEVVKLRVEDLNSKPFELITSRAVSKTKDLMEISTNISSKDSKFLLFKGDRVYQELKELKIDSYKIISRDTRKYLYIDKLGSYC